MASSDNVMPRRGLLCFPNLVAHIAGGGEMSEQSRRIAAEVKLSKEIARRLTVLVDRVMWLRVTHNVNLTRQEDERLCHIQIELGKLSSDREGAR